MSQTKIELVNPFLEVVASVTPLPAVVWFAQPMPNQTQRGKIDHATRKTHVLRQMRGDD